MRIPCAIAVAALAITMVACSASRPGRTKASELPSAQRGEDDTVARVYVGALKAPFLYTEGLKKAHLESDTTLAVQLFDKAIETDPKYAPAWYEAANVLATADPVRALTYSIEANKLDTANVWYRSQMARLYIMTGRFEDARRLYEELVRTYPSNPDNYSMLAMLYQQARQPFRAITLLDSAETYLGRSSMLLGYKRELLIDVQLYDRAIAETESLIAEYPYDYENYLGLAEIYAQTGKDSLAGANYQTALSLNPQGVDILVSMNEFYRMRGDISEFFSTAKQLFSSDELTREAKIAFFEEITRDRTFYGNNFYQINELGALLAARYPNDYDMMSLYGGTLIAGGNIEEALRLYKNNLRDSLPDKRLYITILDIETYLNRGDSVEKYARAAQAHFPSDPDLYLREAASLAYMEKYDRSLKAYNTALKHTDKDSVQSVIHGLMGDVLQRSGNDKQSYRQYEKALKLWPDNIMALNNYSYYMSERDRELEKALTMSARVMELEPGNATYIDTYGWILYKLGRYDEAKKYLQQAISLDSRGSDEIFLHYGDVLHKLGDNYMATVYWRKALDAGHDKEKIEERLKMVEGK